MSTERDPFLPAPARPPPPAAIPPAVRACFRALAQNLARLAALLARYVREEEARRAARMRRRRGGGRG